LSQFRLPSDSGQSDRRGLGPQQLEVFSEGGGPGGLLPDKTNHHLTNPTRSVLSVPASMTPGGLFSRLSLRVYIRKVQDVINTGCRLCIMYRVNRHF